MSKYNEFYGQLNDESQNKVKESFCYHTESYPRYMYVKRKKKLNKTVFKFYEIPHSKPTLNFSDFVNLDIDDLIFCFKLTLSKRNNTTFLYYKNIILGKIIKKKYNFDLFIDDKISCSGQRNKPTFFFTYWFNVYNNSKRYFIENKKPHIIDDRGYVAFKFLKGFQRASKKNTVMMYDKEVIFENIRMSETQFIYMFRLPLSMVQSACVALSSLTTK
jgi:hypothetical protein